MILQGYIDKGVTFFFNDKCIDLRMFGQMV